MLNSVSSLLQTYPTVAPAGPTAKTATSAKAATPASPLGEDRFVSYGRMAGLAAGGGFAAYKLGGQMANNFKELATALKPVPLAPGQPPSQMPSPVPSLQRITGTGLQAAGLSALVSAGVSALSNGIGVARGKLDGQTATKNVISDGISGAIGGFGAVSAAGAGSLMLSAFGLVGLPLTIGTVAFGAAGGVLAGRLGQNLQKGEAAQASDSQ